MESFSRLDHVWVEKFLEHRIADRRVLRLIRKWLNAGVIEDGQWSETPEGSPQGASVSPLIANVYLHYVFDRWFEHKDDAERFLADLRERFTKFNLELHPEKTRLIEFGRFAAQNRRERGLGRPETFDFLGLTHICGAGRSGAFWLRRATIKKRLRAKLKQVRDQLMRRRHWPIPEQGRWLASVVRGHLAYYAVPGNFRAVNAFRREVTRYWLHALRRRSQRHRLTWERRNRLAIRWLPTCPHRASLPGGARSLARRIDEHLVRWAMQKFKRLRGKPSRAWEWLADVRQRALRLFAHWQLARTTNNRPVGAV